jgi:hypothetical protein
MHGPARNRRILGYAPDCGSRPSERKPVKRLCWVFGSLGSRQTAGSRSGDSARKRACGARARLGPSAATRENPFLSYQRPNSDRGLPLRCISTAADRAVHARSSKLDTDTQRAPKTCLRRPKTGTRSGIERATLRLVWKSLIFTKGCYKLSQLK